MPRNGPSPGKARGKPKENPGETRKKLREPRASPAEAQERRRKNPGSPAEAPNDCRRPRLAQNDFKRALQEV